LTDFSARLRIALPRFGFECDDGALNTGCTSVASWRSPWPAWWPVQSRTNQGGFPAARQDRQGSRGSKNRTIVAALPACGRLWSTLFPASPTQAVKRNCDRASVAASILANTTSNRLRLIKKP